MRTMFGQFIVFNTFCVILVASMVIVNPGPQFPPTRGEVWPKPQVQNKHEIYYKLRSDFNFTITGETCHILTNALERYEEVVHKLNYLAQWQSRRLDRHASEHTNITGDSFKGLMTEIEIQILLPCEEHPQMGMDEIYHLNTSTVSILKSNTIWGALRGLETFVQLLYISEDHGSVFINATEIVDYPRYPHRGVLLDTGRHYISVPNILKTLDAMEMNKMNVLHWHIVDDQSFPYHSEKFPQLSEKGAYAPSLIYTKGTIQYIVNYARDRGIRVLPEIDVPGHTRSWGVAYPNVLTKCYQMDEVIGLGPMDPTKNVTYKLIGELFEEVQQRFPEQYFHVGGDEVELNCWTSNPEVAKFMTDHGMTQPSELHAYFMNKTIPLLGHNAKPIVWQEVFDEGVPLSKDSIIQVWKSENYNTLVRILNAGHKLIYSASWYMDQLKPGGDWIDFYQADPRHMIPKSIKVNLDNIVGGEACMWAEVVDDSNVISRVWPRASAVAEKLWSAETPRRRFNFLGYRPPLEVFHRLEEHTCRMNRRGVHAQPPNGPGFCVTM